MMIGVGDQLADAGQLTRRVRERGGQGAQTVDSIQKLFVSEIKVVEFVIVAESVTFRKLREE